MFSLYKFCVFIGMYLITLAIGFGYSYLKLKKEGVISNFGLGIRNASLSMGLISVILLSIGIYTYSLL